MPKKATPRMLWVGMPTRSSWRKLGFGVLVGGCGVGGVGEAGVGGIGGWCRGRGQGKKTTYPLKTNTMALANPPLHPLPTSGE